MLAAKTTQQLLPPHSSLVVQISRIVGMDNGHWDALYALPIDRTAEQSPDAIKRESKVIGVVWIVWIVWIACLYHPKKHCRH